MVRCRRPKSHNRSPLRSNLAYILVQNLRADSARTKSWHSSISNVDVNPTARPSKETIYNVLKATREHHVVIISYRNIYIKKSFFLRNNFSCILTNLSGIHCYLGARAFCSLASIWLPCLTSHFLFVICVYGTLIVWLMKYLSLALHCTLHSNYIDIQHRILETPLYY